MGVNDPKRISFGKKVEEKEVIMFPVKGDTIYVTPSEALSIINHISGALMAYEFSGGFSSYSSKYL